MSRPALNRRERHILRGIERDLLDDEEFVRRLGDLPLARPPLDNRTLEDRPPPDGPFPPDGPVLEGPHPDSGVPAADEPPPPGRRRRPRLPGPAPGSRLRLRDAVRNHGLVLLVPVSAALAAITFGGAPAYLAVVFVVVLAATVLVGVDRFRHRRR